jgi:Uma2 family endonuclease
MKSNENPNKVKILAPDVSYIAFEKVTKKYLNQHKFINIPPTLCIEIVSSKGGLKQNLRKMEDSWMTSGTDIGLVVCPHTENYFLFKKDKTGYQSIDFAVPFTHPQLSGLTIDFAQLLKEVREEND